MNQMCLYPLERTMRVSNTGNLNIVCSVALNPRFSYIPHTGKILKDPFNMR